MDALLSAVAQWTGISGIELVLLGLVLAGVSGLPGLFLSRNSSTGQRVSAALAVLGAGLGLCGIVLFWVSDSSEPIKLPWSIPGGQFSVALDGLSAIFLLPIFLISPLGSIYGLDYWKQTEHPQNGRKLRLFYGTMTAGMALLVISRNSILFLFGWEIMALSAYFLVGTEDDDQPVREAAWIYLVATHLAMLSLVAFFALLHAASGSFALEAGKLTPGMATALFILALVGFGIKAGIMPLHVWLPGAHAMAPSHVSALMSGVFIKMGIYGLVRFTSLIPDPPVAWGAVLLGLGVVSGVLGVAFAVGQHDLKRLLAYHSIENIGIIVMGLGLALVGRSLHQPAWVLLGLGGALLHVWNHALFKSLLFLSAGSVIHAVHTREIDQLGGLAKKMPWTALGFLVGAVAICGLPPLNGFVSEFLIYLGLFDTLTAEGRPYFAGVSLAAPALALIGALAVACFVKVYGAVFLGTPRSPRTQKAHESPSTMIAPMGVLVGCCFLIGFTPFLIEPILRKGIYAWAPDLDFKLHESLLVNSLEWIPLMYLLLVACLMLGGMVLWQRLRGSIVEQAPTWGCGYVAPSPRMQYTSSSFAQMLVGLFGWALRPRTHEPTDLPLFPRQAEFHSEVPDPVLDEAVLPAFRCVAWLASWFRVIQRGSIQTYLLYVFIALMVLLMWH